MKHQIYVQNLNLVVVLHRPEVQHYLIHYLVVRTLINTLFSTRYINHMLPLREKQVPDHIHGRIKTDYQTNPHPNPHPYLRILIRYFKIIYHLKLN